MKERPWREIWTESIDEADVCVLGVTFDGAASVGKGTALGPDKIRECTKALPPMNGNGDSFENLRIYDNSNVPFTLNWEKYYDRVEENAYSLLKTDKFCLFLGGDHSITIPLGKAFFKHHQGSKIGVIHFDSHPDLCDEFEDSKWSHGCPLKRMTEDVISPGDLAQVGIRSYEQEEVDFYKANPDTLLIKAEEIFLDGFINATEKIIEKFKDYDVIYITLDIDVLDPAFAPGTGTPESGGLTTRELLYMIKEIMKKLPVRAMDLVEVSPTLDTTNHITSWAAAKIIYEVLYGVFLSK